MNNEDRNDIFQDTIDQKIAIQMITFGVIIIVVIITLVSFIHIYSNKKEDILKDMSSEYIQLETVIIDQLNYSVHFTNLLSSYIKDNHSDLRYINNVLKNHLRSEEFYSLFGWRKYSWVDKNFNETVNSIKGILPTPRRQEYILELVTSLGINNSSKPVFYSQKGKGKDRSLKIIDNLVDKNSGKYLGSLVLSHDIETLINSLNLRKKAKSTNFVILDKDFQVIAQSKSKIQNLINANSEFNDLVKLNIKKVQSQTDKLIKGYAYLDMINGLNYYIKPLAGLPFILVVNIDSTLIRNDILSNLAKSFLLLCIFASLSLSGIIYVYRRETFLRTKAERATLVAENSTKAKSNFLAFTAHEIRSPLGFILTGSEIMTKEILGNLPTPYKKYAQGIHNNSKLILDFITDILDENQIIEGKFKITNRITKIDEIIKEAVQVNIARYNSRKITIDTKITDDIPSVICDKRRILQVMSNLVSNSIKYSEDDTTITITVKLVNDEMVICVQDQGIGMKEKDIPVALSAYGTLREQNYNSLGSYGLGLAIVKMLLEAHDAELKINSVEGKGTTVKIIFPKYKLVYNSKLDHKK
ncbi:MAG: sensor histidine kinase [Rickettsiales bacterium]|nr:sensor histidine kinase [Rickettsiales bacterium]MCA0254274.1 HAMP domain-containing histidine kinase [Pseudomonadota bacterium]